MKHKLILKSYLDSNGDLSMECSYCGIKVGDKKFNIHGEVVIPVVDIYDELLKHESNII